jgi:hypothetical protein
MSVVSGITLICRLSESEDDEGTDLLIKLNTLLTTMGHDGNKFSEVSRHYGGHKHPQCLIFGAGINYLNEDEFAEEVLLWDWKTPENIILIIQPEDGPTRVFRPKYVNY